MQICGMVSFKNDEDRIIKKVLMLFPETQCIIKPSN